MVARTFCLAAGLLLFAAAGAAGQEKSNLPREGVWSIRLITTAHEEYKGTLEIRFADETYVDGNITWKVPVGEPDERFYGSQTEDFGLTLHASYVGDEGSEDDPAESRFNREYRDNAGEYEATVAAGGRVLRKGSWNLDGATGGYWSARWLRPLEKAERK